MLYENIEASCFSDELLPWLPMGLGAEAQVKYFRCDPIRGELIALLKAPSTTKLPRHHHSGTVIVYTLKGKWKYQEHDWVAGPGSVVYETAASTHTPEALPEGGPEVVALNVISGDLVYYDEFRQSNYGIQLAHRFGPLPGPLPQSGRRTDRHYRISVTRLRPRQVRMNVGRDPAEAPGCPWIPPPPIAVARGLLGERCYAQRGCSRIWRAWSADCVPMRLSWL